MLFTSIDFLLFLPLAIGGFALAPARWRWAWLLAASWVFYGWGHPASLVWLAGVTAIAFAAGAAIERAPTRALRIACVAAALAILIGGLAISKFTSFATAPAGFSFYVFGAASYVIDRYAGRIAQPPHAGALALYVAWFPKILAGPIERATAFLPRLASGLPRATPQQVVLGCQMIGWGLVKKVVVADNLAPLVDRTFNIVAFASPADLLLSVYFFAFQIYCDFSGYTDIATGASLLFGIELMENFRRPYFSRSTAEFWSQRWHISLGRWFRDYLYIPLGGSRHNLLRQSLNVMIVFAASGLWHAGLGYGVGWTFLVWGALNGGYQVVGLVTRPLWSAIGRRVPLVASSRALAFVRILLTFHLIAVSWIFFRAKSLHDAWLVLQKIAMRIAELPELLMQYPYSLEQRMAAVMIAVLVAIEFASERRDLFERLASARPALRWATCYLALFVLLVLGRWQAREFIYMQF